MTVPSTARRAGPYDGNGATTSFSFSFKTFAAGDLLVTKMDAFGIETTLVLNSDYSVTLNGDQDESPGGSITYPISGSPLAAGQKLTIVGDLEYEQTTDLLGGGAFNARVIEDTFDRTAIQIQQLVERADRSLTLPVSATASTVLPGPQSNKLIGWDEAANALQNYDPTTLATIVAFGTSRADTFTGNGVQTQFALTANPGALANLDVAIGGVTQTPGVDYTFSGTTLTFISGAPANGVLILARYFLALPQGVTDSAASTFLQAGAGAVTRTVQSKLREVISVFDFMTSAQIADVQAGNLTQNVTSALQACVAALTRGQTMYFPKGAYLVTSTLTINKSINIVGESKFDSIIYGSGFITDSSILDFTGTTGARIQDIRMEDISIWSSNNLARGMTLTWVNKSSFSNLYFYNLYRGVYGDNAWGNNWKNVSAYSITTELFNYGPECNNNHFDRVEFRGATGIKITGNTAGIKFTACDFEGITDTAGYGCLLAPVTTKSISGVVFDGCYFENIKGAAIACDGVDAASVRGLVVKGNYFFGGRTLIFGTAGTAVNAIILLNVSGFRVSENMFLDWQTNAIFRNGTEVNGSVENNILSSTPQLTNSSNQLSASVNVRNNTFGRKEEYSASVPTSGTYTVGDFVWNMSPSKDVNSMLVLGWSRATTGTGHVVGTDWVRAYVSNLSPAT